MRPSSGIFLTQGSNPGLLHCRQILYHLSHSCIFWTFSQFYSPSSYSPSSLSLNMASHTRSEDPHISSRSTWFFAFYNTHYHWNYILRSIFEWMHLYSSVHSFLHPFNYPSHPFLFGHETNYRVFWIILEVSVFGSFSQFAESFFAAKSELRKEIYISKTITVLGSWGHFLRSWQSILRCMLDFFYFG